MAAPNDIAASLPQAPPPAPGRREAAIGLAMRRFDGADMGTAQGYSEPHAPSWLTRLTRQQAGALVTAMIVAALGVPIALVSYDQWSGSRDSASAGAGLGVEAPVAPVAQPVRQPSAIAAPNAEEKATEPAGRQAPPPPVVMASPPAPQELARGDAAKPVAPMADRDEASGVVAKRRQDLAQDMAAAPAMSEAAPARQREASGFAYKEGETIVTGSRLLASPADKRGDWNMCTVNDPDQVLRNCRHLINPEAKGDLGKAAAKVEDGVSRAWRGDNDGAKAVFDEALATSPRYAFAWLNRGLLRSKMGDTAGAIADLDQAVRFDSASARNYYLRAQLLRKQGDLRRARADERRALELNPNYTEVLR